MENYEKLYKDAIQRAKEKIVECGDNNGRKKMIMDIFQGQDLSETEDERIKRDLIRDIDVAFPVDTAKKYISWLDKNVPVKWNEEDNGMLQLITEHFINCHGDGVFSTTGLDVFNGNAVPSEKIINWLKSLKPQPHWKPSKAKSETKNKCPNYSEGYGCSTSPLKRCDTCSDYKLYNQWKPTKQNIDDLEWCASVIEDKMGAPFHRLQVLIDEIKSLL